MRYNHRVTVRRPNPDLPPVQDPETGAVTEGGMMTVLASEADVQDMGESHPRTTEGQPWLQADATIFLPPHVREELLAVEPDDVVWVEYPDTDRWAEGVVKMVRELDDVLLVRFR